MDGMGRGRGGEGRGSVGTSSTLVGEVGHLSSDSPHHLMGILPPVKS